MKEALKEADLLAIKLYRDANNEWYAVGTFRDQSVGKNGNRLVATEIPTEAVSLFLKLLATRP
jgi:hypothetical protein